MWARGEKTESLSVRETATPGLNPREGPPLAYISCITEASHRREHSFSADQTPRAHRGRDARLKKWLEPRNGSGDTHTHTHTYTHTHTHTLSQACET